MRKRWFTRRSVQVCTLVVGIVAVAAGVAYATIPDSGGVYTACMLKNVGTLRLIDPSLPSANLMSHCTSRETQITWNQKGQPGPTGPAGPPGSGSAASYRIVSQTFALSTADNGQVRTVDCAPDENVTGGGASSEIDNGGGPNGLVTSYPSGPSSWSGYATGYYPSATLTLYAICVS